MERLPADVLLMVLRYLDPASVLACRLVCTRLEGLALHPHVWRHRTLAEHKQLGLVISSSRHLRRPLCPRLCAALRLAPVLDSLDISLPTTAERQQLYATTRCAVAKLCLTVDTRSGVLPAARVIRNQDALGRLRDLYVYIHEVMGVSEGTALLAAIVSASGLVKLHVYETPHARSSAPLYRLTCAASPPATPSLRHFCCNVSPQSVLFGEAVLAAHAATLEVVELGLLVSTTAALLLSRLRGYNPQAQSLLRALPGLPALRHLLVGFVPDEFLLGIRPDTAPSLQTLRVFSRAHCAHDFLHRDAVQRLLTLNTSLQLFVCLPNYCLENAPCEACTRGCHQELCRGGDGSYENMTEARLWPYTPKFVLIPR